MQETSYAVFVFKRRVKTYKGLLSGVLKEENGFFSELSIPKVKSLKELVGANKFIERTLKAFSLLNETIQVPFKINDFEYILTVSEHSVKPYSIILKLVSQDIVSAFRESYYNLPVATVLLDNESKVLDVNPQFERLFGFKRSELIGKDLNKIIVPQEESDDGYKLDEIAKDTGYVKVERERLSKNGSKLPVLVSGSPFVIKGEQVGIIGVYEDIRDIKKIQQALYYQATHDLLTGLPNRYLLEDRFKLEKARADRNGSKVALFFIDINRFKDINDTYGHEVGDRVIKFVADLLVRSVRATDSVIRFGGDEFVIVFDEVKSIEDIVSIVEKVVNAFTEPFVQKDVSIDVGVNIGIAVYPDEGTTLDELLRKGDIAMYEAKAIGTNNFVFYSEKIEEARLKTISDLKAKDIMFKLVFEKSPLPQIIIDDELNVLRINDRFKEVFNVNARKIYGKKITEIEGFTDLSKDFVEGKLSEKDVQISVKMGDHYYNTVCRLRALKSLGRTFYLLVFEEVR